MIDSLEAIAAYEHALVFGLGGGGDVVGAIPTARYLESMGLEVDLGGMAWVPVPRDVRPGPRPLEELVDIVPIAERIAMATKTTRTVDAVPLAEAGVASEIDNDVLVFDVSDGPAGLLPSVASVAEERSIDLIVGVDAGGDVLARGTEAGIQSPLTDAIGLAVLTDTAVASVLGVIGYGSDGELTRPELDAAVGEVAAADAFLGGWAITPRVRGELERILERVETEASRLPVEAARGAFGNREIRGGERVVDLSPASAVTFYFDPATVARRSTTVDIVASASSLEAAATELRSRDIQTEFDTERRRMP